MAVAVGAPGREKQTHLRPEASWASPQPMEHSSNQGGSTHLPCPRSPPRVSTSGGTSYGRRRAWQAAGRCS